MIGKNVLVICVLVDLHEPNTLQYELIPINRDTLVSYQFKYAYVKVGL